MKRLLLGLSTFTLLTFFIYIVIVYSNDSLSEKNSICQNFLMGFININDFFTSLLIIFGFGFAFLIYLSNQNIFPNKKLMNFIDKVPEFLPFKHALQKYLSKLIKKDFKIIVLIRPLDKHNHEWVLNQISAYNNIMGNPSLSFDKTSIKFLFVKKDTQDIRTLILGLHLAHHDYILITGLSAIFKSAILAREELEDEEKECIQIIGSLSSIHDQQIQKIIDTDEKVIRIFPPDYDEAKTAINFLFSKIKNSICPNEDCDLHGEKHNIIIIHNGTYGRAIRNKCAMYFDKELLNLNVNTSTKLSATELNNAINFYTYDYKNEGKLICDKTNSETFEDLLTSSKEANNHFYIIGYEPNISSILKHLDNAFNRIDNLHFSILFSGTASMSTWRRTIKATLENTTHLNSNLSNAVYYLQLHTIENINTLQASYEMNLNLEHYNPKGKNEEAILMDELMKIFPNSAVQEHSNLLESYWKNENNYIITFTSDSLRIARYSIKYNTTLLASKFQILRKDDRETDILVNGDSINQYTVRILD